MVLAIIISLFCFQNTDPLLSIRYQKKIDKCIAKSLEISKFDLNRIKYDNGELYKIESGNKVKGILLISEVASCNLGGCPAYDKIKNAKASEYFDLMVIMDPSKQIKEVRILDYFSDYGYEVTSRSYLKKFRGKEICLFSSQNDGIDVVSGATVSSYALEGALSVLCDHFNYKEQGIN